MKIFFVSSKIRKAFNRKYVLAFFITALTLALLSSQLVSHIKNTSEPAMSQMVAPGGFSVTLDVSGNISPEGAMIVVNGENYAPLKSSSSVVELERASVIEIFCETNADFSVSVKPSVGTSVIMTDNKVICKKGINYICRCFFAD